MKLKNLWDTGADDPIADLEDINKMFSDYPYYFAWKNNEKRKTLFKRHFKILARGTMNSRLIEFSNGQREIISGAAIHKLHIWY